MSKLVDKTCNFFTKLNDCLTKGSESDNEIKLNSDEKMVHEIEIVLFTLKKICKYRWPTIYWKNKGNVQIQIQNEIAMT